MNSGSITSGKSAMKWTLLALATVAGATPPSLADPVLLRVVFKPDTRTLLTHDVTTRIGMGKGAGDQGGIRLHMLDDVEDIVRSGEKPGELMHENRRLARTGNTSGSPGFTFDSRKWEAGGATSRDDSVEDWKRVRATTWFLHRGADGKAIRTWAEGPGEIPGRPPSPGDVPAYEDYLESKVFWPDFLPSEPVAPGAVWPLKFTTHGQGAGGPLVDAVGQYSLKSIEQVDGRRLALIEFSGTLVPAPGAPPPAMKPPSGKGRPPMPVSVIEKGTVEGSFILDLERQFHTERSVRAVYISNLAGKFRQEFDLRITQTILSQEPLPSPP